MYDQTPRGDLWLRIDTGYAVVGLGLCSGVVVACAPIVRYMSGWTLERLTTYAHSKGWLVEELYNAHRAQAEESENGPRTSGDPSGTP